MPNRKPASTLISNSNLHSDCNRTSTDNYLSTERSAFAPSQTLIRLAHRGADSQEVATERLTMEFPDEEEIRENSIGGKNISWDGPTVAAWGIPHPYPKGWMDASPRRGRELLRSARHLHPAQAQAHPVGGGWIVRLGLRPR